MQDCSLAAMLCERTCLTRSGSKHAAIRAKQCTCSSRGSVRRCASSTVSAPRPIQLARPGDRSPRGSF